MDERKGVGMIKSNDNKQAAKDASELFESKLHSLPPIEPMLGVIFMIACFCYTIMSLND